MTTFQNNYQLRMWISNSNLTFPALQSKGRSVTNTDSPTRSTQQFFCVSLPGQWSERQSGMVSLADPFFLFKNSGFLVAFFFNMQSPLNHLCSGLAPGVFGFFCAFWYFGDWHRLSPQVSPSRVHMCSLDFAREVGFIFFCLLHDIGRDNSPSNLKKNLFP